MKIKILLASFLLFLCSVQIIFAQKVTQTQQKEVLICSDCGFPLSAKPIVIVKPEYPKVARMVNVSGAVQVEVTIDQKGNVIEAKAVSGHPLLQASSINAALQTKFKPILLRGTPIRVTGIIVYNFALDEPILPKQIEEPKQKVIVDLAGETVTGKAITLFKPPFPTNCRCKFSKNRKVTIQFTVDEDGNVDSANGITGHPLLRAASEAAIRKSKFSISRINGVPVKAFGIIIYDFVISGNRWRTVVVKQDLKLEKQ